MSSSKKHNPYKGKERFTSKAKSQGYPARSVYKLEEIDKRLKLLRPGQSVLDLGASPGSWSLFAARKVGPKGHLVALDLKPLEVQLPPQARFLEQDIFETELSAFAILNADQLHGEQEAGIEPGPPQDGQRRFDVVLSDMAPRTTGNRGTDQARSFTLFERALQIAEHCLKPGGAFVGKIFQGPDFEEARNRVRTAFRQAKIVRPEATRSVSYEVFIVGLDYKG